MWAMTTPVPPKSEDIFLRVLKSLLKPLVRALIAHRVTAPAVYRLLKRAYVEVAASEFSLDGTRPTDSRISMLTGVHRRDVRAFREEDGGGDEQVEEKVTVITSVLGRWLASAETTDENGNPIVLPRASTDGPSFEDLVSSISKDVRPRTVLDELVRQGLVVDGDGMLEISASAFVGPEDMDQRVFFFSENIGDHIAAATDNLTAEQPRFLERAVFYNLLSAASVDEIEDEARRKGAAVLTDLNKMAHERQQNDRAENAGTQRFRFGIYFYRTDESATGEDE